MSSAAVEELETLNARETLPLFVEVLAGLAVLHIVLPIVLTTVAVGFLWFLWLSGDCSPFASKLGRKKRCSRSIGVGSMFATPTTDVVGQVNAIFNRFAHSTNCVERVACQLEAIAGDLGLTKRLVAKMADFPVTAKYKPYYKQFVYGENCEKIKCRSISF